MTEDEKREQIMRILRGRCPRCGGAMRRYPDPRGYGSIEECAAGCARSTVVVVKG